MARIIDRTYTNERVMLDGHIFENCVFEHCTLEYLGVQPVEFINCRLIDVSWQLNGPAANTVDFLNMLATTFGPLGEELVTQLFHTIRHRRIDPHDPTVGIRSVRASAVLSREQ